jgi:hypothetical protein
MTKLITVNSDGVKAAFLSSIAAQRYPGVQGEAEINYEPLDSKTAWIIRVRGEIFTIAEFTGDISDGVVVCDHNWALLGIFHADTLDEAELQLVKFAEVTQGTVPEIYKVLTGGNP